MRETANDNDEFWNQHNFDVEHYVDTKHEEELKRIAREAREAASAERASIHKRERNADEKSQERLQDNSMSPDN